MPTPKPAIFGLHRLLDHSKQLLAELYQVNLLAQCGAKSC